MGAASPDDWLRAFERRHGRPLRVLHVGNIANNAYNNAKIQRRHGIEADVACYEYWHIMGCPEWEDADFEGEVDQAFPDWRSVDLHGFRRPPWFAQGRIASCQRYLLAYRRRQRGRAWFQDRMMRLDRWLRCRTTFPAFAAATLVGIDRPHDLGRKHEDRTRTAKRRLDGVRVAGRRGRSAKPSLAQIALPISTTVRRARYRGRLMRARLGARVGNAVRIVRLAAAKSLAAVRALHALLAGRSWRFAVLTVFPRRFAWVARTAAELELVNVAGTAMFEQPAPVSASPARQNDSTPETAPEPSSLSPPDVPPDLPPILEDPLTIRFRELFPTRYPPLTREDCAMFLPGLPGWRQLFRQYDVIQGYAVDPIIPRLAGETTYAAYEHGTLRNIPFEDDAQGRMCAFGYREATVVFVTNSDVLESARRLGLADDQMVLLPHAVDSDKLLRFAEANNALAPPTGSHATFFSPTRQDWVSGHPDWSKGNDRMIRALAIARDRGFDCRFVLVAWGKDLEASRDLIAELDLAEHVEWLAPMRKRDLWKQYLSSHAVIDQFLTPAIGGVTFEAMALGRRVITALDPVVTEEFFGKRPPVLVSQAPAEIAEALCRVAADPGDEAGLGEAAREWFRRYHSSERIVRLQLEAYARMLGEPV
jgi:glycosyltransferase involved in cell wall biosynthesis